MKPHAELTVYLKQSSATHALPYGATLRLGRGTHTQIRVDDPSVSRDHLLIHVGEHIEVEDLGSANGTQIYAASRNERTRNNTEPARLNPGERYKLEPGSVLKVGSVPCMLSVEETTTRVVHSTIPPSSSGRPVIVDPEMKRIYELAARAAQSDIGVLIHGETGSGKELLAEAVHNSSRRRNSHLLKINCGAIAENLLESELFGHERGAFTGAHSARAGLFEATNGGTVFMDEIGEMPLATQVKLLRVLEERRVRRIGASKSIPIDVRFVAATNRDLEQEVERGTFRRDLYYRISGLVLRIPPLRQRSSEIEPLARHFLMNFCLVSRIPVPEITEAGLEALRSYSWPGNVRELRNAMERAPFLSTGLPIGPEHLPKLPQVAVDFDDEPLFAENEITDIANIPDELWRALRVARAQALAHKGSAPRLPDSRPRESSAAAKKEIEFVELTSPVDERERIIEALQQCQGNQTKAALLLGVSRRTLINRLESFGLPRPRKREP